VQNITINAPNFSQSRRTQSMGLSETCLLRVLARADYSSLKITWFSLQSSFKIVQGVSSWFHAPV